MRFRKNHTAKVAAVLVISAATVLLSGFTAWATETIKSVRITVKSQLTAGDSRKEPIDIDGEGTVVVTVSSKEYEIGSAKWASTSGGSLSIGEEPKMIVTLTPVDESEAYFKSAYTKKEVKVSGGDFVSARKSGADLMVTLKVSPVKGSYEPPDDAYWKEAVMGKAEWEVSDKQGGAYEVWLYRDKKVVHKENKVRTTALNLFPYMTEEGVYTFRVRTVPYTSSEEKNGKKSEWVESGELIITARDVSDGSRQKGKKEPSDDKKESTDGKGWFKQDGFWYYRDNDENLVQGDWLELGDDWYLFQADGRMLTGWHQIDGYWYYMADDGRMMRDWGRIKGKWYYFNPSWSDEPIGAATVGWNVIDGYTYYFNEDCSLYTGWLYQLDSWYYLNELEGSLEGAMLKGWIYRNGLYYYTDEYGVLQTGWKQIDGQWYYLYPDDGHKAVDTLINGFYVNEDGIWKEGE